MGIALAVAASWLATRSGGRPVDAFARLDAAPDTSRDVATAPSAAAAVPRATIHVAGAADGAGSGETAPTGAAFSPVPDALALDRSGLRAAFIAAGIGIEGAGVPLAPLELEQVIETLEIGLRQIRESIDQPSLEARLSDLRARFPDSRERLDAALADHAFRAKGVELLFALAGELPARVGSGRTVPRVRMTRDGRSHDPKLCSQSMSYELTRAEGRVSFVARSPFWSISLRITRDDVDPAGWDELLERFREVRRLDDVVR